MTYPHGGAAQIWRDGTSNNPEKWQIRDWGGDVEARIENVEASAVGGKLVKATWAELLTIPVPTDGYGAEVLETDTGTHAAASATGYDGAAVANSGVYSWNAAWTRWVRIGDVGLAGKASQTEFAEVQTSTQGILNSYGDGLGLMDQYGFEVAKMSPYGLSTEFFELLGHPGGGGELVIADRYGFSGTHVEVTVPLMPPDLYGVSGVEYRLHTRGLMQDRSLDASLLLNGSRGFQRHGQYQIWFDPARIADGATLSLHTERTGQLFGEQALTVHVAPQPPVNVAPVVLALGNSILTRGGASIVDYELRQWGYNPTFVGTLPDHGQDGEGPVMCECKPGFTLAQQTYLTTTGIAPLPPGDEAIYAALTTTEKRAWNTILRAASGEAAADIRNGYVLDFPFYFARHGLTPATILVVTYGTNDIRDVLASGLYDHMYSELSLVIRRWFAAYPDKHVEVAIPGTGFKDERNLIWRDSYVPVIRGMIKAAADETAANAGQGKAIVVPAWASSTPYSGYDLLDETVDFVDPATGAQVRDIEDAIHPTGGSRYAGHDIIAAGIACAAEGTI